MTTVTHFLRRARTHPVGVLLGGASGAAAHHWLEARSNCASTFLQECTPRPSGAAPAFIAFVLVGMILGVVIVGTLRDQPGA